MENVKEEVVYLFSKVWAWCLYVLLGLMAKYSYDIIRGRRITLWQALASAGLAFFVGFIASVWCISHDMEREGMWIVPIATLMSEKIIMAIFAIDWNNIFAEWARYWADKFKK